MPVQFLTPEQRAHYGRYVCDPTTDELTRYCKGGRKRQMTDSKIVSAKKLLVSGVPPKDVAKNLGVSLPTLYRWVPASAHA